jgi:hypothetical protein
MLAPMGYVSAYGLCPAMTARQCNNDGTMQ